MPHFTDAHGVHIHYEAHRVPEPSAVVQLAHGVGEHIGRYAWLIAELNATGYTVYANDHRGHGQTGFEQHGGDLDRMGRLGPGGLRAAIDAVRGFTGVIRDAEPDVPLVFLGHSWGSLMGQIIVNRHPLDYDGVVFTGTAYRTLRHMESGDLNRRFRATGDTGMEWLSRDAAVAQAFIDDPYTTTVPLQKLFGLRDAARLLGRPARGLPPELPLLILVGTDDPLGGAESARCLALAYERRAGLVDVSLIAYEGARHELFQETNRDAVIADLVCWLDERFAVD
ncbi:alpha/beta fold hydrolase [Agromyces archimandritae]|uniref:Alpha/beta fold hydrolase n=1 Tax=Agromyces archimandritae TaxID=2781962 RepID=A0A975IMK2_9MICO|nr:alpha/beta fold hydrolase [Agromyces archimandritae]QTX03545.1 alpha/beta fold hydrolase [Agromyces archimandritae]